ncbi:hypothetical protein TNCV_2659921 [Trichonephila clavipes]|uniref:Uncharacterized protein n=1 Tax=Trichonephila clavipes TaxID=2585209 RepID=A0A8X6RB97_TRICX|nr:hypothetical protein TNCV_2659921 [Trichonephila clavipes]
MKKRRKEVIGYKRPIDMSRSGGAQKENVAKRKLKREIREAYQHQLTVSIIIERESGERKQRCQNEIQACTICGPGEKKKLYSKDPGCKQQSTSQSRQKTKREGSGCQNSRSRRAQQQLHQEIGGKYTSRRTVSLEVLVGDVNNKTH